MTRDEEPPPVTDKQIRDLFALHCECRPLDVDRTSHSHDCDDDILEDCRVALGGRPNGVSRRSTATAIIQQQAARRICAGRIAELPKVGDLVECEVKWRDGRRTVMRGKFISMTVHEVFIESELGPVAGVRCTMEKCE